MKKVTIAVVLTLILVLSTVGIASAITDGELDGAPLWRCSGTLISPTLFLTAGHCTEAPAAHVEIWFDAYVENGRPENGYPYKGDVGGTPYTHPQYDPNAFFLHNLGVVVLKKGMDMNSYGALPELDKMDTLASQVSNPDITFTSVGYGLQKSFPDAASWQEQAFRIRMVAHPKLNQINTGFTGDYSLLLSNNTATGGTCFGDSGGPNFLYDTNIVVGVTSYGLNSACGGTGGVYRVDKADDLDWLKEFSKKRK